MASVSTNSHETSTKLVVSVVGFSSLLILEEHVQGCGHAFASHDSYHYHNLNRRESLTKPGKSVASTTFIKSMPFGISTASKSPYMQRIENINSVPRKFNPSTPCSE